MYALNIFTLQIYFTFPGHTLKTFRIPNYLVMSHVPKIVRPNTAIWTLHLKSAEQDVEPIKSAVNDFYSHVINMHFITLYFFLYMHLSVINHPLLIVSRRCNT